MAELIFSKFSNERSPRFSIETDIYKDDSGERFIIKRASFPEGKAHFDNLIKAKEELSEMFKDSPISLQPAEETEDGCKFPFITGGSMQERLNRELEEEKFEQVFSEIEEYFSLIKERSSDVDFSATPEFTEIFGDVSFPDGTKCGRAANLDYGFGNVIESEKGSFLIDYEWTFFFPVPVEFLLYRVLHYFVYTSSRSGELIKRDIFARFGFDGEKLEKYASMEKAFHSYITGGMISVNELRDGMLEKTWNVHEIYSEAESRSLDKKLQVYFDYGEGFFHENSHMEKPVVKDGKISLDIDYIPENAVRVRIDVRKNPCVLEIFDFYNENGEKMLEFSEINGRKAAEGCYICNVPDPWVVVKHGESKKLHIEFTIEESKLGNIYDRIAEFARQRDEELAVLKQQLSEAGAREAELERQKAELRNIIHVMENSTSWKMTKPVRSVLDKLKGRK